MFNDDPITTESIKSVFAEEIASSRGKVSDAFDDGQRLFLRSILPDVREVRAKDRVQGGVALRSNGADVLVHPYLFRQVCTNGAILAQTIQTRRVSGLDVRGSDEVLPELREAIQACCDPEAFALSARQMRTSQERDADLALSMMSFLNRFSASITREIVRRFLSEGDTSDFGLANAITATARDTSDPEVRWDLEELGGGVLAGTSRRSPQLRDFARVRREVAETAP